MWIRRPWRWWRVPRISMWCSRKICLATFSPIRQAQSWDRWACWARPASGLGRTLRAGAWLCAGHRRARHRQSRWARFWRRRCCCATPSSSKLKLPALSLPWLRSWRRDPEPKIWRRREESFLSTSAMGQEDCRSGPRAGEICRAEGRQLTVVPFLNPVRRDFHKVFLPRTAALLDLRE